MPKKNEQSSAERRFNAAFLGGKGKFEALTLHLPGGARYTPDFCFVRQAARTEVEWCGETPHLRWGGVLASHCGQGNNLLLVEVKGSYRLQSHARAATAFKTACACFPEFDFCWAELQKDGKSWKVTFFRDGAQLGDTEIFNQQTTPPTTQQPNNLPKEGA